MQGQFVTGSVFYSKIIKIIFGTVYKSTRTYSPESNLRGAYLHYI